MILHQRPHQQCWWLLRVTSSRRASSSFSSFPLRRRWRSSGHSNNNNDNTHPALLWLRSSSSSSRSLFGQPALTALPFSSAKANLHRPPPASAAASALLSSSCCYHPAAAAGGGSSSRSISSRRLPPHHPATAQVVRAASTFASSASASAVTSTSSPEEQQQPDSSNNSSSSKHKRSNVVPFLLADIGEGIKEVELLQWFVQAGDAVQQFDKICEVQSDKATVEITSRYDGRVVAAGGDQGALPHRPGDMVQVGEPLLYLEVAATSDGGGATTAPSPSSDETAAPRSEAKENSTTAGGKLLDPTASEQPQLRIPTVASRFRLPGDENSAAAAQHSTAAVLTSPAVRQLGRQYGVDLSTLRGRGPRGRLLKHDVVTYLREQGLWRGGNGGGVSGEGEEGGGIGESETTAPPAPTTTTAADASTVVKVVEADDGGDEIVALRGYHRTMARSMAAALQTPHMGFGDEIVCNALLDCRRELNRSADGSSGSGSATKISVLALLVKAVSAALSKHPAVNSVVHSVDDLQYRVRRDHNIGIAMDTPRGLVVPVIRQCQERSVAEIQRELDRLKRIAASAADGAAGRFAETDLSDPTFTLSNIGSVSGSGTYMQPVLAPPALAMGALGRIKTLPRFVVSDGDGRPAKENTEIYAAHILTVSWCADHRFLDGATLARFHRQFQDYVEHPVRLLAELK